MTIIGNVFITRYSWVCGSSTCQIPRLQAVFLFFGLMHLQMKSMGFIPLVQTILLQERWKGKADFQVKHLVIHVKSACLWLPAILCMSLWVTVCHFETGVTWKMITKMQILVRFLQRSLSFRNTEWLFIQQRLKLWDHVNERPHSNQCFHTDCRNARPCTDSHSLKHNTRTSLFSKNNSGNEPRMSQ